MKNIPLIIGLTTLFLLPMPAFAMPLLEAEVALGWWRQSPAGYISYASDDRIDLEDVLNYDGENRLTGRVKIDMPSLIPNLYLMASPMEFKETAVTEDFYEFGDIVITPGQRFQSKLILDHYDIALYYNIPLLETATFNSLNVELGINTRIYKAEATVSQEIPVGIEVRESEQETILIPMAYIGVRLSPVDKIFLEGEFRGITYSGSDMYSLIGRVKLKTLGPLFVAGGYRYEKGETHDWDIEFDLDASGPFIEAGLAF